MKTVSPAFNLLELPPLDRKIVVYLARNGDASLATLAQALAVTPTTIQTALDSLIEQGRVRLIGDGQVKVVLGRTRQRTLPARLWPALQAASRIYSTQEIVTLRTVVPILQFARAKLGEFTDHGPGHVLRVKLFATQLGHVMGLTPTEQHLLRAAALFHDVGNVVDRARHHIISQETVEQLAGTGRIPFSPTEAALVGLLCRWHRKEYDPIRRDELHGQAVRTGLLASILRVADALDSDYRRFDYSDKFIGVLRFFYPHEMPFWDSLAEILGIRILCNRTITLQLFVHPNTIATDNMHIHALRKDVADTPLDWPVQVRYCRAEDRFAGRLDNPTTHRSLLTALLVFPFEPHSVIMAALSQKQLVRAGYAVQLLVYPDAYDATNWLWQTALADFDPAKFTQLIVIGDRPDPAVTPDILTILRRWQTVGIQCTWLNRHEGNWVHLPAVLQTGADAILGGDWAYFWGDDCVASDLFWGQIAALCSRDPNQATVGVTTAAETVAYGLLNAVYDAAQQTPDDPAGWAALATPLLERIAADDRVWFTAQAEGFIRTYATLTGEIHKHGQVLQITLAAAPMAPTCFWALEQAIEQHGRTPERGICFTYPYAIATWPVGDGIELLAINHWREEEAIPIRLLYPNHLGPPPNGNESAISVRLPVNQAAQVVQALVIACNQQSVVG